MGRPLIDIAGKRFGKLKVIEVHERTPSVRWRCQCDCGKSTVVDGTKLRQGITNSCGCLRSKLVNHAGSVFGRLTVLKLDHIDKHGYWLCRCSCGKELVILASNFVKGNTRSCGCIRSEDAGRNVVIRDYKKKAIDRGYQFDLTIDETEKLLLGKCVYCGAEPANQRAARVEGYEFVYNGIDRIDNTKGYVKGNVVSCCRWCNIAKRERTVDAFKTWVLATAANVSAWPKLDSVVQK